MAPGVRAAAATPNLEIAYREESTPGSAITNLAAAKLEAHKAHRITMTPLHATGSNQPGNDEGSCVSIAESMPSRAILSILTGGVIRDSVIFIFSSVAEALNTTPALVALKGRLDEKALDPDIKRQKATNFWNGTLILEQ